MGLSSQSTGKGASKGDAIIDTEHSNGRVIALAGNPNVGKSTVFNSLTGLRQHTGNWTGKTVTSAVGIYERNGQRYILVDIPGTYSLSARSAEEEVARDFVCFGKADATVVVCDATGLERNINLVLQIIEAFPKTVVCLNLMDEAARRNIKIDIKGLERELGVPVVDTCARNKNGLERLIDSVDMLCSGRFVPNPRKTVYPKPIEQAVQKLCPLVEKKLNGRLSARFTALRLIEDDQSLISSIEEHLGIGLLSDNEIGDLLSSVKNDLMSFGLDAERIKDRIVSHIYLTSEEICNKTVHFGNDRRREMQLKIDRILTGKLTGIPVMLVLLGIVFWITIVGANYPSELLSDLLFWIGGHISSLFKALHLPEWFCSVTVDGIYRVLAWVVSVMLPPMAIFFPLFTLLEDLGYLPRIAFNLDNAFRKCSACGKQALTMCIGKAKSKKTRQEWPSHRIFCCFNQVF